MPERSFIPISSSTYVSTPEACFLQMARGIPLVKLIVMGYELCGSYAVSPHYRESPLIKRQPRTSIPKLKAYLGKVKGVRGSGRADKALRFMIEESASPMETALAMILCLPPSLGGFNLPKPKMNYPITTNRETNYLGDKKVLRCDLCWPEKKFALEYDSDLFHAESRKINKDSKRRTLIEAEGYHVISVTKNQIYDKAALRNIVDVSSRYLGKRIRISTQNFDSKHDELRNLLLFDTANN